MLREDCTQIPSKDGNKVYLVFTTPSGRKLRIIKPFDKGGVGKVYLAMGQDANNQIKKFVIKEYPVPQTPLDRTTQRNIRKNLVSLIKNPVTDGGKPLDSMVPPLEIINFPKTGTFGYVMDYVELTDFVSVGKLLGQFPEADVICTMARKICRFFDCLATSAGVCYKDVNEGNIYLNPQNGEIRVIDNDNVGDPSTRTISGTGYYMAPEILMDQANPDRATDRFSLAVFLLRMFTGARPYDGSAAYQYMERKNQNIYEAAPVIFGSKAVFIFDPNDTSNTVKNVSLGIRMTDADKQVMKAWQVQSMLWDRLPQEMRDAFIQTFAIGREFVNRNRRTTARQWEKLFSELEKNVVTCKHCHRKTFGNSDSCFYCGKPLPVIVCKNCGKKTPSQLKVCVHCGHEPKKAPVQTNTCPHCAAQNPPGTTVCGTCQKYIVLVCAKCGTVCNGTERVCTKCGTALLKTCPNCGKQCAQNASKCLYCGKSFPRGNITCSVCGRINMPGQMYCVGCKSPLSGAGNAVGRGGRQSPGSHVLHMDLKIKEGTNLISLSVVHKFPSGELYYLDSLVKGRPHKKVFALLYNQKLNLYALKNCSGADMAYRKKSESGQGVLGDGERVVIGVGDVFKLCSDVQMKIVSMK